jgi:hypothetical protein
LLRLVVAAGQAQARAREGAVRPRRVQIDRATRETRAVGLKEVAQPAANRNQNG